MITLNSIKTGSGAFGMNHSRYEYYYEEGKEESACVDINECNIGSDRCDENALCFNEPGGYQCRCKAGYNGDGFSCMSKFLAIPITSNDSPSKIKI